LTNSDIKEMLQDSGAPSNTIKTYCKEEEEPQRRTRRIAAAFERLLIHRQQQ
jgi:hypothetical protein